jgi:hypothetical protein
MSYPIPLAAMWGPFLADSPSIPCKSIPSSSPAVSVTSNCKPPMVATPSILSLVTPGLSYTIACFLPTRRLNREDLPTFGRPTITTLKPLSHPGGRFDTSLVRTLEPCWMWFPCGTLILKARSHAGVRLIMMSNNDLIRGLTCCIFRNCEKNQRIFGIIVNAIFNFFCHVARFC